MSVIETASPPRPAGGATQSGYAAPPPSTAAAPSGGAGEQRRDLRQRGLEDHVTLGGSLLAAIALAWVIYYRLLPTSGLLGFVIVSYLLFVGLYTLVVMQGRSWQETVDRVTEVVIGAAGLLLLGALVLVLVFTFVRGFEALTHPNFFTEPLLVKDPKDLDQGGVVHAIIGTLEQMTIAVAITLPLGVGCAVFMSEFSGRLSRVVRTVVEAMTALPSIVAGLFILVAVIMTLGVGRSGFAAALALSVMMLPIITRSADVVLRLVPQGLREASLALGASRWQTVWRVVLPTARPGLATALILGVARGVGETSPVLLTAGYSQFVNANPFSGWQASLPLFVYSTARLPEPAMIQRAFGAAAVLLAIVLVLFVIARLVAARRPGSKRG